MPEPVWHDDEAVAARGMCAAHRGLAACGCAAETCAAARFSSFAQAAVAALYVNYRLIRSPAFLEQRG